MESGDGAACDRDEAEREDLAREALSRKTGVQSQLTDLQTQYASLQGEEEKLTAASQPESRGLRCEQSKLRM